MYEEVPADQSSSDAVGRPLPVKSALNNALGKAVFIDDILPYQGRMVSIEMCVAAANDVRLSSKFANCFVNFLRGMHVIIW